MDALPQRSYDAMKRQATNGGRKNLKRPGNLREQVDSLMCQAYDDARKEANVRMWPTPTVADTFTANLKSSQQKPGSMHSVNLSQAVKMFPTPTSMDSIAGLACHPCKDATATHSILLSQKVKMFPTPTSREWKGGRRPETLMAAGRTPTNSLCDTINALEEESGGNLLNPDWVEWLMGLPVGWTSIDAAVQHTVPNDYWDAEPDIPRVSGSTPNRADRLKCLGNMVVPQQFYPIFAGIAETENKKSEG